MINIGKYKSIVVSIALFLLLDASVLILNFYISFEISEDAVGVNLAGRQRMLSQRMVKSLLNIQYNRDNEEARSVALQELDFTVKMFDETLIAFDNGGEALGASGENTYLGRVTDEDGRAAIEESLVMWRDYKLLLNAVINSAGTPGDASGLDQPLRQAIAYADDNNLSLLALMNKLTVSLERVATSQATRLRIIQTIGISFAIINFFIILFHFIRQLRESDAKLEVARNETLEILETVNEGLFLIDKDFNLGSQYSTQMHELFSRDDIQDINFQQLLEHIVNEKDLETAKRFVGLLYRDEIKDSLIHDLNPLKRVEVSLSKDEQFEQKYYSFGFSRVYSGTTITDILATVRDITEQVRLEKELEETKKQGEQQLEVLTGILHANADTMSQFLENSFRTFEKVNDILKTPGKSSDVLREKLLDISSEVHSLKGESSALGLGGLEMLAHDVESEITRIMDKSGLSGEDFLPIIVKFDKLIKHTETVNTLAEKISSFSSQEESSGGNDDGRWDHLQNLTHQVSDRNGKKVNLVTSGLAETSIPASVSKLVNNILIQCIRNAICHGIENPTLRKKLKKSDTGRIDVRFVALPGRAFELTVEDDGRGFNLSEIRTRAAKLGLHSDDDLETFDSKQLMALIFRPGFSTASNLSLDAGRGVGLEAIKNEVKAFGGKLRITNKVGLGVKFVVTIPHMGEKDVAA